MYIPNQDQPLALASALPIANSACTTIDSAGLTRVVSSPLLDAANTLVALRVTRQRRSDDREVGLGLLRRVEEESQSSSCRV